MKEDLLGWIEAQGEVTSAQLADAAGLTLAAAANQLLRLYRNGFLARRREASFRSPVAFQYVYWLSRKGVNRLCWRRGG